MERIKNGLLGALGLALTLALIGTFAAFGLAVLGVTAAIGVAVAGVAAVSGLAGHTLPQDQDGDAAMSPETGGETARV